MSNKPKASVHVKPCNTGQSELHNRRDPEYIKKLNPKKLYVRLDLTKHNASYVAPEMEGVTLDQYLDSIRVMAKQKTGRAMQEKEIKYPGKGGKRRWKRSGASRRSRSTYTGTKVTMKYQVMTAPGSRTTMPISFGTGWIIRPGNP